jgi:hypothetical protein
MEICGGCVEAWCVWKRKRRRGAFCAVVRGGDTGEGVLVESVLVEGNSEARGGAGIPTRVDLCYSRAPRAVRHCYL